MAFCFVCLGGPVFNCWLACYRIGGVASLAGSPHPAADSRFAAAPARIGAQAKALATASYRPAELVWFFWADPIVTVEEEYRL